jgi:NADPH2:quinone reductase
MKLIHVKNPGGPEALEYVDGPVPTPGEGQALVKVGAIGVNYIDVYFRTGLYKADLPFTPGNEGAGVIEAVGPGVAEFKVGDRVAWGMFRASYAEYAAVPVSQLVKLPDNVNFETGAAAMLQGMTAHYLSHSTWPLKQGDTCLVHAAAGGAGRLLVQMAKMRGATVFGTCGTKEKAELVQSAGADAAIVYTEVDFAAEVMRLTGGKKIEVIYDSVGQTTFLKGLDLLRPRGMMALFGQASGPVDKIDPAILNQKGSLFLTRPSLAHHCLTREELNWRAGDVLGWIAAGKLELRIAKKFPLAQASEAHRAIESRAYAGKLLLVP